MNTLHLTLVEQNFFKTLPDSLREGWEVSNERLGFKDTSERRELRLSLLRLHDPKLVELREKVRKADDITETATIIADTDLSDISDDDMASLFFALGPEAISHLIAHQLQNAKTDKDMEGLTALTVIRHSILEAYNSVSHASR